MWATKIQLLGQLPTIRSIARLGYIFCAELQPNPTRQARQRSTSEQPFNKLMVASNLIYCTSLNPAPGTEQSVSSRVFVIVLVTPCCVVPIYLGETL